MNDAEEICPICLRPKRVKQSSSLTQWIVACHCDKTKERQANSAKICSICKKTVGKRNPGSLTQWILKPDTCRCEFPEIAEAEASEQADLIDVEQEELKFLDLQSAKFDTHRFRPIEEIGRGSIGTVYLCFDSVLSKRVAVKVLNVMNEDAVIAFQKEATALSKLNHPNIVKVLDFGAHEQSSPYMVLDYIKGNNLESYLNEKEILSNDQALEILIQVSKALKHAHAHGIYHGDLKPANLIIEDSYESLQVKVIDFGLVRYVQPEKKIGYKDKLLTGTPHFMCPDQALGLNFSETSEIYSLGCIAYLIVSGNLPFDGETAVDLLSKHVHNDADKLPETVNDKLATIIMKCLQKDHKKRYKNASELLVDLDELKSKYYSDYPLEVFEEDKLTSNQPKHRLRYQRVLAIAAVLIIPLLGTCLYFITQTTPGKKDKRVENKNRISHLSITFDDDYYRKKYKNDSTSTSIDFEYQQVTNKVIDYISHLPVKSLNISFTDIDDKGLKKIAGLMQLEVLIAKGTIVSPKGIEELRQLPHFRKIDLSNTSIDDSIFAVLSKFKKLERIDLIGCNIKANKIGELNSAPKLKTLDLTLTPVKFSNLLNLKRPTLEILDLEHTGFSDNDIKNILHLKNLRTLVANGNPITDKGLLQLAELKKLRRLKLIDCHHITNHGIKEFLNRLPKCSISRPKRAGKNSR